MPSKPSIPVIITGAAGKMGRALVTRAIETPGLKLAGATEHSESPAVGQDVGVLVGIGARGVSLVGSITEAQKSAGAGAVIVDFTGPTATLAHLQAAAQQGNPIVIGTTGFTSDQKKKITAASKKIPIVLSPNMSVGVNTLFRLAAEAARILGEPFDIEVFEAHHRLKKDAPSGTAVKLAEVVAEATGRSYPQDIVFHREGITGPRTQREIGMQVIRGGDIVGEHTVYFCGMGERVEIRHVATSRHTFADGALRAALWLSGKKPGLYDMGDVLGITKD